MPLTPLSGPRLDQTCRGNFPGLLETATVVCSLVFPANGKMVGHPEIFVKWSRFKTNLGQTTNFGKSDIAQWWSQACYLNLIDKEEPLYTWTIITEDTDIPSNNCTMYITVHWEQILRRRRWWSHALPTTLVCKPNTLHLTKVLRWPSNLPLAVRIFKTQGPGKNQSNQSQPIFSAARSKVSSNFYLNICNIPYFQPLHCPLQVAFLCLIVPFPLFLVPYPLFLVYCSLSHDCSIVLCSLSYCPIVLCPIVLATLSLYIYIPRYL